MPRYSFCLCLLLLNCFVFAGNNKWTSTGPFGADVVSIQFDPSNRKIVYALSDDLVRGSLFRSGNSGLTWQRLAAPSMFQVRVDPLNPSHLIGTGFDSADESTDRGKTWKRISFTTHVFNMTDLEFHPQNSKILYGISNDGVVVKSTDTGRNWTILKNFNGKGYFGSLEVDPRNGEVLFASIEANGNRAFKSTDGGLTWIPRSKGLANDLEPALEMDPVNPDVLYAGGFIRVFKTTNGGQTWIAKKCISCGQVKSISIDPTQRNRIYTSGAHGGARSTDGGETWVPLEIPSATNQFDHVAVQPATGTVFVTSSSKEPIFRSTNQGLTWKIVAKGLDDFFPFELAMDHLLPGRLITQETIPYETTDGGRRWKVLGSVIRKSLTKRVDTIAIHPKNSNLIASNSQFDGFLLSLDGGKTFEVKEITQSAFFAQLILTHPEDQRIFYVVGNGEGFVKTTDQGSSWKIINKGLTDLNIVDATIDPNQPETLYASAERGIFKTTSGGDTWTKISQLGNSSFTGDIAIHPIDSNILFTTNRSGFFKSTNGGKSWKLKLQGDADSQSIIFSPDGETIYANPEDRLFVSVDGGEKWAPFNTSGLKDVNIIGQLAISPVQPDTLYATTDRGVFSFTFDRPAGSPLIKSLFPNTGKVGDVISINGKDFGTVQGKVHFGSREAIVRSWSPTRISVEVPAGISSSAVIVSIGSRKSNPFEFILLPDSGGLQPSSGKAGTEVTMVLPKGFNAGEFEILFGSTLAGSFRFIASNIVVCAVPSGNGTVDVSLVTTLITQKIGTFTYQ